jgi:hypothetical protein
MSPLSWPVVVGTLAVGSPALYAALASGTLSPDVALVRVLLCAVGVWAVCSLVASLATKAVASNTADLRPGPEMQRPADVDS